MLRSRRILITGACGYLGRLVVRDLLDGDGVELLAALDMERRDLADSENLRFVERDVTGGFADVAGDFRIDTIVHLAFPVDHLRDREQWDRLARSGTERVLEAAEGAGVRRLIMVSSTVVYGASLDGRLRDEGESLRPTPGYTYAQGKALMEELTERWASRRSECRVAIVRPCVVLGPRTDNYMVRSLFQQTPFIEGRDPRLQFLHEMDFTGAMRRLVAGEASGTYNLTPGDEGVRRSDIHRLFGMPIEFRSASEVRRSLALRWAKGGADAVEPAILELISGEWSASSERLQRTLGWSPAHSSLETLLAYSKARRSAARRVAHG